MSIYTHARAGAAQIQSDQDALDSGYTGVSLWLAKIERQKEEEKEWRQQAREASVAYDSGEDKDSLFNIFHANIETLVPSLYNSTPIPDVRRRYAETDRVARLAAETVERGLNILLDRQNFDGVMRGVVQNGVVPGRGVPRVTVDDDGMVIAELVPWDRFICGPGRVWSDVKWIAIEDDLTQEDLIDQLGLDRARLDELGFCDSATDDQEDKDKTTRAGVYKTIRVYQIWDKRNRQVIFITDRDEDKPLRVMDDPYGLAKFFPVPEPFQQIRHAGSLIPRCQYKIYKPLLEELDVISKRIRNLVAQLRVRGVADPRLRAVMAHLQSAGDGEYVAAQNAEEFVLQGNKLGDLIDHFPLQPIVVALAQLYAQREQIKQQIYEVTGISDIMRGTVDSREKLGQSQIKAKSLSVKLNEQQKEVQRVARDLMRMMAQLALNITPWEVVKATTRMDFAAYPAGPKAEQQPELDPARQQMLARMTEQQVRQLLQSDMLGFSIDIETDSTLRADLSRNQETFQMMLQGSGQFIQAITAAKQVMPENVPAFMKVYQAFLRQFQFPKDAEDALEQLAEQPQEKDDPKLLEAQQMIQQLQQEIQSRNVDMEKHQATIASNEKMKTAELEQRKALETRALDEKRQDYIRQIGVDAENARREEEKRRAEERFRERELELQERKVRVDEASVGIAAIKADAESDNRIEDREDRREARRQQRLLPPASKKKQEQVSA